MRGKRKIAVSSVKRDHPDQFRELFFAYHGRLVVFAHKFTGDLQVSQDIVQDAFLKLWEKSPALDSYALPRAYLFQSVKNSCLNHLRHIKIRSSVEGNLHSRLLNECIGTDPGSGDPLQSLLEQDVQEKIDAVIQSMPEKCKEVFLLSRNEMLKNREIAEKMDISVKMVEKHISRALLILRTNLSEYLSIGLFLLLNKF